MLKTILPLAVLIALVLSTDLSAQEPAALPLGKQVDQAIDKAVKRLLDTQNADGSWPPVGGFRVGPTALALYALIESGLKPDNPNVAKGLRWITARQNRTDANYELSIRANMWLAAYRSTKASKYLIELRADGKRLEETGLLHNSYKMIGMYPYSLVEKPDFGLDNSNNNFGLLGVWAASRGGYEVAAEYWKGALEYWIDSQGADGGYGYRKNYKSEGNMSAAGLASLLICYDQFYSQAFIKCNVAVDYKPLERAQEWMGREFAHMLLGGGTGTASIGYNGEAQYFLYTIERAGLAGGYKYFGTADWYKIGAALLLKHQEPSGGWGGQFTPAVNTAFSVLFLVRGRNPILFNKLQFDSVAAIAPKASAAPKATAVPKAGAPKVAAAPKAAAPQVAASSADWNNRPRDLDNLSNWMSERFERTVNWQIINLKVPVAEWHDAPILYISGTKAPSFTPEELDKLRQYVLQGGTILSVTACNGQGFSKGIKDVYSKLFPQYEMVQLPADHDIYTRQSQYDIKPEFKSRLKLGVITNGVRPLVIHTDEDLSRAWQAYAAKSLGGEPAFQIAANICMYMTDKDSLRGRATHTWPEPYAGPAKNGVKIVRLKWSGNYDPEPLALERFGRLLAQQTQIKLDIPQPIAIGELAAANARVAILSGVGEVKLNDEEKLALKQFVTGGGLLVVDAAGGDGAFGASASATLEQVFRDSLRRVAQGSELYNIASVADGRIDAVKWRKRTGSKMGQDKTPNLRGLTFVQSGQATDRLGVIFSKEDVTSAGLVGYQAQMVDGYDPGDNQEGSAYRVMRNIVLYAMQRSSGSATSQPATAPAAAATQSER